ncbi:hypothetical protein H0H92_014690 [Tricholoma furcatifolium]|nr:hypothetical protein H0H92_014690 [Tricholoma furcatifolium]
MVAEIDKTEPIAPGEVSVDLLKDLTQVTLLVIGSAGSGRRSSFKDDTVTDPPPGHKLAFRPAVTMTLRHVITKAIMPKFLWNLSESVYIPFISPLLTECRESFAALGAHMHEVIASARDLIATGKAATMDSALLRNLVQANMMNDTADSKDHLSDDDLLSNTFTFLLAGRETSAHSLCFALAILALYPDIQQQVFEESLRIWPDDIPSADSSPPPYKESMANLEFTLALFHETLRHFPPVARLAKNVAADTTLPARRFVKSAEGKIGAIQKYDVDIKRGSVVVIDIRALHFNRVY